MQLSSVHFHVVELPILIILPDKFELSAPHSSIALMFPQNRLLTFPILVLSDEV